MPVEVLTREEIERLVEEKLKKLLTDLEIWKKVGELEASVAKLKEDTAKVSIKEAVVTEPEGIAAALTIELAHRADLLHIGTTRDSVTLKPRGYLRPQDFRAVSEIVRKYGGFWSSERRMFIVRKRG
ncbi:hypothetical protein [[Eubacterium] cellulosolvens]